MSSNIKFYLSKIFLLFCLVVLFSCDNRKVCIEADDFGFEDIERFDVESFLSPQNEGADCSYRQEENGFSSINTDLYYCLNGVASGQDHCEESYDGYVAYNDGSATKYCRFINNDLDSELTDNEVSCLNPNDNPFRNKGCNIGSTDIRAWKPFTSSSTSWGVRNDFTASLLAVAEIKARCVASCVERCKKKRACSHIASRQPIKSGTADVVSPTDSLYKAFNPYDGTFPLKHSLDGNLFVASSLSISSASVEGIDNYTFTWTDSSSELKQMFSQLREAENKKKLSLAIKEVPTGSASEDGKSILINDFDGCSIDNNNVFTCVINKNRDLATKDKFSRFFPILSGATLNAVAIFDYVKIQSNGININDRTISTQTQHHFGTNSIVEIISSLLQYKIKVKKILNSKQFIYEEIAGQQSATISDVKDSCSGTDVKCFLIPSVENVDWQDKFMPPWKATTSKSSATATGGLQISAGSKVEIEATGQISLGSSEEKVCHKNIASYTPNLYEDDGVSCGPTPKIFDFTANTKYQPNAKIILTSLRQGTDQTKYTLYRSLKDVEKADITHTDPTYNDLCKSFCYSNNALPTAQNHFACDVSVPNIRNEASTNCIYNGISIATQYNSAKEQVRIANYAKRVFIDSSSVLEETVLPAYTPPAPSAIALTSEASYSYDDLKQLMPSGYGDRPLLAYFDGLGDCSITVKIMNSDFSSTSSTSGYMYKNLNKDVPSTDGVAITSALNKPSILYPETKLLIKKTSGNCSNLTITPYPYIEFTATQSGFVAFKSTTACQLKQTRVANDNTNYPKQKISRDVATGKISFASNSGKHNIFIGNQFVDAVLNKIFNAILNIYHSFAAASAVVNINPYNQQGANDNFQVCDACFATAITKRVDNNNCGVVLSSGCGGIKSSIASYDINGFPTATPQDGKPGKITITFLDGEELIYSNPGVYHLSVDADRKITKIEAIGGGGGASYDFSSPNLANNNGGHAQILKIEAQQGGINIVSGDDPSYKTEDRYTLKIMVGHGGKNSTEINNYKTFSGLSHRDSYNYALYKKDFGYAGGFGDASVVGFVHKTIPNKIKILAVAGGGGGGAGKTCNDPAMFGDAGFNDNISNHDILHNSTYDYLQGIIKCNNPGEQFLQNLAVSKLDCGSPLTGFPGRCVSGKCSILGANTASGQSTESATVNHGDTIYCITGYTETLTNPSVALTANCAVASGSGTIVGGTCTANVCNAVLSGTTGVGKTTPVPNAISTGDLIPSSLPTSPSPMNSLSCGTGYSIAWSGDGINKATCTNSHSTTNITVGSCVANSCNAILTSTTGVFGIGDTRSVPNAISTGITFSSAITITGLSCGDDYNLSWGSGVAVCTGSDIPVGNCTKNCLANNLANAIHGTTTSYVSGQTATCNTGYGGTGTQTRTCQNDGTWNGICTANTCNMPAGSNVNTATGQSSQTATAINHDTTLYCLNGYTASSALKADCSNAAGGAVSGGSCTANNCNAVLKKTSGDTVASTQVSTGTNLASTNTDLTNALSCGTGYSRAWSGTGTAFCTDSTTNITVGTCAINTCNSVSGITGYPARTGSFTHLQALTCDDGYTASAGGITANCITSGEAATVSGSCTANNTCTIDNASGNKTHNTSVSCNTGYGIVNKQTAYAYCPTNGGTGTLRTAQNGGGSVVSCEPINGAYYDYNWPDKDDTTYACVDRVIHYAIAYVYLDYQTSQGEMDQQYSCTGDLTVRKADGRVDAFDENNIQDQEITYCLIGYTAVGRGSGQCR